MRVVAYLRVSSVSQIDAWGLDRQESAVRRYAKANGHRIVAWERDEGVSGTIDAVERPGLSAAIARISRGVDAILVADLDRLARALTVQETALALVWKAGGQVITAVSGVVHTDDPEDPSRTLIRQVMGAVIEFEKRQAVARMRGGMLAKAATGKKAIGSYAYGYQAAGKGRDRDAGPEPIEQRALQLILELRADGRSYPEICDALTAAGHRTKRRARWHPMTVKRIYDRERARETA